MVTSPEYLWVITQGTSETVGKQIEEGPFLVVWAPDSSVGLRQKCDSVLLSQPDKAWDLG